MTAILKLGIEEVDLEGNTRLRERSLARTRDFSFTSTSGGKQRGLPLGPSKANGAEMRKRMPLKNIARNSTWGQPTWGQEDLVLANSRIFFIFLRMFGYSTALFGVRRGFKMILSHRAPSSFNMSSYRAIWTPFRPSSYFWNKQ